MDRDIIVTWPKSRTFASYIAEVHNAERDGLVLNFRVRTRPGGMPERCYMVHDGAVRGWLPMHAIVFHEEGAVARVKSDPIPGGWPAGWYLVRLPNWHDLEPVYPMAGFRGYRYFDRTLIDS